MQNFKRFLSSAVIAVTLATQAAAQDEKEPTLDTVVATVNGQEITVGHMLVARASLPQQFQELPVDVLFPGILDQLIQQSALAQTFDGELPKRATLALDNETRSLKAGEVVESILQGALTDDAIQAMYEQEFADKDQGEEYNASHILVETEEAAQQIITDLEAGGDFAEIAKEKSTGPSGPNGGSLGWFGPGMMVPSFEAATIALEPGEISAPIKTQFGWHVIKLNETRIKSAPPLEDVREELENRIRQSAVEKHISDVTAAADVTRSVDGIDQNIITKMELLD